MRKSAPLFCALLLSLSARRAWIEISYEENSTVGRFVALRKESVDRNIWREVLELVQRQSLSARRAWIEIITPIKTVTGCVVALRKESVDRNQRIAKPFREQFKSLSARRAWIEIAVQELIPLADPSLSARRAWIEICGGASAKRSALCRSPQGERG